MFTGPLQLKHLNRALIASLLALLLSLATYNSSGVIRGGDEDEGSGVGGTGRTFQTHEPTGSGLGGTGFRPYLGYSNSADKETGEIEIIQHPQDKNLSVAQSISDSFVNLKQPTPLLAEPIDHSIVVADSEQVTRDSAPISIAESIQWEIDSQIISLESSRQLLALNAIEGVRPDAVPAVEDSAVAEATDEIKIEENKRSDSANENEEQPISWLTLAQHLNSNVGHSDQERELATASAEPESAIAERPERFQRPALPPVQRIQPVHRTGLLPPRIRPLRL